MRSKNNELILWEGNKTQDEAESTENELLAITKDE